MEYQTNPVIVPPEKDCPELHQALAVAGHYMVQRDNLWLVSDVLACQELVDTFIKPMPNLNPRRFAYLMIVTGIRDALNAVLPAIKQQDLQLYATIRSKLDYCEFYVYDEAIQMLDLVKHLLLTANPQLNLEISYLRVMWEEAFNLS